MNEPTITQTVLFADLPGARPASSFAVSGESGIGKSSLLQAFAVGEARAAGSPRHEVFAAFVADLKRSTPPAVVVSRMCTGPTKLRSTCCSSSADA